jgi:hypothetical protein
LATRLLMHEWLEHLTIRRRSHVDEVMRGM